MENTQLDGEIRFSEALHKFKQNVGEYVNTSHAADSSKTTSGTSTLEVNLLILYGISHDKSRKH